MASLFKETNRSHGSNLFRRDSFTLKEYTISSDTNSLYTSSGHVMTFLITPVSKEL